MIHIYIYMLIENLVSIKIYIKLNNKTLQNSSIGVIYRWVEKVVGV